MIHTLHLRNFKGIEAADLRLERFTVLVGPNASGKTSVLQALDLLSALSAPQAQGRKVIQRYGGRSALSRNKENAILVRADGTWSQEPGHLQLEWKRARPPKGVDPVWQLLVNGKWREQPFTVTSDTRSEASWLDGNDGPSTTQLPSILAEWRASILLRLESRRLAEPSEVTSVEPRIDTDGTGLASSLAQMALNQPDNFSELLLALRAVIPQIIRVRLDIAPIKRQETEILRVNDESIHHQTQRNYFGHRILFDTKSSTGVPGEAASEGTLLVLGLLTVLMSQPRPRLVLLDDLDRGLHPKAQRDLVTQLRKLLEQNPELQIIATSHSPYLVDHLDPKEVRLSTVSPDGTIRFAALTDHPDFERWKDEMRPGEFWSTVGESWVGEQKGEPTR